MASIAVGGLMVWVLTKSFNDYDQHGDYFEAAWVQKPTREQLLKAGVDKGDVDHVLNGGGRTKKYEHYWWDLFEHEEIS